MLRLICLRSKSSLGFFCEQKNVENANVFDFLPGKVAERKCWINFMAMRQTFLVEKRKKWRQKSFFLSENRWKMMKISPFACHSNGSLAFQRRWCIQNSFSNRHLRTARNKDNRKGISCMFAFSTSEFRYLLRHFSYHISIFVSNFTDKACWISSRVSYVCFWWWKRLRSVLKFCLAPTNNSNLGSCWRLYKKYFSGANALNNDCYILKSKRNAVDRW